MHTNEDELTNAGGYGTIKLVMMTTKANYDIRHLDDHDDNLHLIGLDFVRSSQVVLKVLKNMMVSKFGVISGIN